MQTSRTKERREALVKLIESEKYGAAGGGILLIPGNELSPNSYPSNAYYFRQDSTFRYLFGVDKPTLFGAIDLDNGSAAYLFGDDVSLDDIIWTGPQKSLVEIGAEVGIEPQNCKAMCEIPAFLKGRKIHILPPYRGETKLQLSQLGIGSENISAQLIFSVAELREKKSQWEIAEIEKGYLIGYEMHTRAMQMCRTGVVEREIGGVLEGIARSRGNGVSFPPICTQHGETLHNTERENVLQKGRLFLCDAGAETLSGYCSDHTRTYPISGKFTDIQRDIYNLVLAAQKSVAQKAQPNMLYTELQKTAYATLAEGLQQLGFFAATCSVEQIIESGAMRLFMPHGVGHGLGLDVHDCEAFGERSFADLFDTERFKEASKEVQSCIIRNQWVISEGTILTNEPGLYFIPALIERYENGGKHNNIINFARVKKHLDFGGIRIEDDLEITANGAREIGSDSGKRIPKSVDELESFRG
ncbi:MAG: aminopeptidase P family protein [Rikenellaceae bacterium]